MLPHLSENVTIKKVSEAHQSAVFHVEGLYTGYGLTIGNALRRALLSSIPGAAITQIKIKGVNHEFSTIPGMKEDIIELTLNLKKVRFKFFADEPQVLTLKARGEKEVKASDIKTNPQVEIVNPDLTIASLTGKKTELDMEITVEKGLGYLPSENRKFERLPIGTVVIDAIFSPVSRVNFEVENMRIGERTDYNRLKLEVETDGSITPTEAVHKVANVLKDHFDKIGMLVQPERKEESAEPEENKEKEKKPEKSKKDRVKKKK